MDCLKIGCGRFLYGHGIISQLAGEIKRYGSKAYLVGGKTTLPMVLSLTEKDLRQEKIEIATHTLAEPNSVDLAHRLAEDAQKAGSEVVVAIGGGRCMDVCKLFADIAKLPMVTVPTSIATCAGCSAVSILYTKDEGRYDCSVPKDHEIESVLLDLDIVASSPKRLTAAGIMDTLAKLPEIVNGANDLSYRDGEIKKLAAFRNSKMIYDFLMNNALELYRDPIGNVQRFDDMALIITLITSMISGFSSGKGQLALAHGLYDASKRFFPQETKNKLHGEIVGLGLRLQMRYNGVSQEELTAFEQLMQDMEIPMKLADIGIEPTRENVDLLAQRTINTNGMSEEEARRLYEAYQVIL